MKYSRQIKSVSYPKANAAQVVRELAEGRDAGRRFLSEVIARLREEKTRG